MEPHSGNEGFADVVASHFSGQANDVEFICVAGFVVDLAVVAGENPARLAMDSRILLAADVPHETSNGPYIFKLFFYAKRARVLIEEIDGRRR